MKITLDQIKADLSEKGWKVLSDEYVNLSTEMEFKCPEGHIVMAPYKKIRGKYECPICKSNPLKNIDNTSIPKTKETRLLALDQATQISGWSLWDGNKLIKYGIFHATSKDTIERLSQIHFWLLNLILNFQPDIVILEDIQMQDFSGKSKEEKISRYDTIGVTTFKSLAELLGVLQVTLKENKIDFKVISSQVWRKGIGIKGRSRADRKRSAQRLVKEWYDINVTEDEADAICIGKYGIDNCQPPTIIKWE